MKLTPVERLILMNQSRIMAKLDPPNASDYEQAAEIFQSGYEGLYDRVFEHVYKPLPTEVSEEVFEIFDMFRGLDHAYKSGVPKPKGGRAEFAGFDGNNDDHFGVAQFILDSLGLYVEQKGRPRNSHSRAELPIYRRMLAEWKLLGKPYPMTEANVKQIVGS